MDKQGVNNKSNILSMDFLKEKHEQDFKMAEAHVNLEGETFSFKLYDKFPDSLKAEYMKDFLEYSFGAIENQDGDAEFEEKVGVFAYVLMLDKFTDLDIPEAPEEKLIYAKYLIDYGLLGQIVNTFEEEEVIDLMNSGKELIEKQTKSALEMIAKYEGIEKDIDGMGALRLLEKESEKQEG